MSPHTRPPCLRSLHSPGEGEGAAAKGSLLLFAPICAFSRKKRLFVSCIADWSAIARGEGRWPHPPTSRRLCVINHPKSTPASQKANQKPTDANQKNVPTPQPSCRAEA